jgi:hypothetical protein
MGVVFDFKANTTEGLSDGGTYFGEMTFRQYGSSTDWSGGLSHQLGFTDNGNIWQRSGSSTTWGSWKKILDSSNYVAYSAFTGQITSTQANSTSTGGGQIYLNGTTGNRIDFNQNGVAAPAFATRSVGTKLVLYPELGASNVDYALGIESETMWFSVPQTTSRQFKWYAGTTNVATLSGTGTFTINGSDQNIVASESGTSSTWRGRILSKNSAADKASFLGVYASAPGVFAHNHALNAWADLYVNTVDGSSGGAVRMPSSVLINGSQALHAGNYNSYSPSLTGSGASGSWGINVTGSSASCTGNAATATTATNQSGGTVSATTGTFSGNVTVSSGNATGGGIILADDGDIVDLNDGYCTMRFSAGVRVFSANRGGSAVITLANSGNVTATSFSGSLTGNVTGNVSGSSGSCTGNASTATTASNLTGLTLNSSASPINPDNVTQNQLGYNNSVSLFGQSDGGLYSSAYSSSWIHQIYGDFRTGQIAIRGKNNGTWQAWRAVLDSSNYTSYSPSLTGSGASGTWGINVTGSSASCSGNASTASSTPYPVFSSDSVNVANITSRIDSGFYEHDTPTIAEGWPYNGSWTHLLACTHSNNGNYYSMQFAASFYSNDLYYRSTNGNGATGWSRIALYNNSYSGDLYASVFRDSDNPTNYYLEANGSSQLYRLRMGPYAGSTSSGNQVALEIMNTGGTGDSNVAAMSFHCSGTYGLHMHLRHDSYFGIGGWSASTWRWYVQTSTGDMTAAGNVTAYSDIRLKENIKPLENCVTKIMKLNGVSFNWKNLPDIVGNPGKKDYGIIAQEVEKVFPEVIHESAHESPDGDKYKTVAYDKLVPVLLEAIKEQQNDINNLKQQIKELKSL